MNSASNRHDLDSVAHQYLGVETIHYEDVSLATILGKSQKGSLSLLAHTFIMDGKTTTTQKPKHYMRSQFNFLQISYNFV